MTRRKPIVANTMDALAASVAAYLKFNKRVERRLSRDLVYDFLATGTGLEVTQEHRELANSIRNSISQRIMLGELTNSNAEYRFTAIINLLLVQERIHTLDIAKLLWAPVLNDVLTNNDHVHERTLGLGTTSAHVGKLSKKIELTYNEISCRYLKNWDSFWHQGYDEHDNLITFYSLNKIPNGSKIVGRVKGHQTYKKHANVKITTLSYVKAQP